MKESRVTHELLFAELRSGGLLHLGHVKRMYMEANGAFTLIEEPKPRSGLSVLPDWDIEFNDQQQKAPGEWVCHYCGNSQPKLGTQAEICDNCKGTDWVPALK